MHRQSNLPETVYRWWRFDRYEIKDSVIRPAPGSRLTRYDPWADFQQMRNQTNGQPAYVELARLVNELSADPATKGRITNLSSESQSLILAWCERYGLLGILPSRWVSVTLSPQPTPAHLKESVALRPSQVVEPRKRGTRERYVRGYGTTFCTVRTESDSDQAPPASVLIHPFNDLRIVEEPLTKTWSHFFPSVPWHQREIFAYPAPYSPAFWRLYGEPLFEFWRTARLFAGIVKYLDRSAQIMPRGAPANGGSEALAREQAIDSLNLLRKDVSQVLVDEGEGLRQQWVSPSLLASFAEMLVLDLVAGRRAQYCECCGRPFVSEAYQARYCSQPCRLRQQKRNLRSSMKRAQALYVEGRTIRQISKSLGGDPKSVQRWVAGLKRKRNIRHPA